MQEERGDICEEKRNKDPTDAVCDFVHVLPAILLPAVRNGRLLWSGTPMPILWSSTGKVRTWRLKLLD